MTQFRNRIAVWSSLHEPVLIFGSSYGSVFESPMYRVHNEHNSRSGLGLLQRSGSHRTNPKCCSTRPTHTNKYKYMLNTLPNTPTYTCTPTYIYIHTYIRVYTLIYIHACIHTHTYIRLYTYIYTYPYNALYIHTHVYI